jgi:DNA-binding HxlR family transcriptional regulator
VKERLSLGSEMMPTLFIGKWTVKIMYSLKERPQRHGQLRRRLGNVSQRMLTRTLRNLESAGLIARQVRRSKSLAVEYSLTKLGKTFIIPLSSICHWAHRHNKELSAIARFSKRTRSGRSPTQLREA